jgi:hypothetical protein
MTGGDGKVILCIHRILHSFISPEHNFFVQPAGPIRRLKLIWQREIRKGDCERVLALVFLTVSSTMHQA